MINRKAPKFICIRCAEILRPSEKSNIVCPSCNTSIDVGLYISIHRYADDAVRFGHSYKKYYNSPQLSPHGNIIKPCLPEPSTLENLISQAVILGVIGCASIGTIIGVIKLIISKHKEDVGQGCVPVRIDPSFTELLTEPQIQELAENITTYYNSGIDFDSPIGKAIEEEILADSVADPRYTDVQVGRLKKMMTIHSNHKAGARKKRRVIAREMAKSKETARKRLTQKPQHTELTDIWKHR